MTFLTELQRTQMLANGAARARGETIDPYPVVKLHTLDAGAVWLLVRPMVCAMPAPDFQSWAP